MSAFALRAAASTSRAARVTSVCARSCRTRSRALHQRRELPYPVEEGLGSFLPPQSLKMIAEDYQQGLLDRLNDHVRGTALENKSIIQTIIDAARDPSKVLEFNYASEALNNSFFLGNLRPPPADAASHEDALIGTELQKRILYHYGSLAQLQSSFSAATLGMVSSGWMWLVTDADGQLGIVPTFGAGTLLVRTSEASPAFEEWRSVVGEPTLQFTEGSKTRIPAFNLLPKSRSASPLTGAPLGGQPSIDPHTPARSMSQHFATPRGLYKGLDLDGSRADPKKLGNTLFPLLCVSVHEHAWISAGYGVWGKEEYMKRFWSVVDWQTVNKIFKRTTRAN